MTMENEWIEWDSGRCPVRLNQEVETITRDGTQEVQTAVTCGWKHHNWRDDVLKYRVVQS